MSRKKWITLILCTVLTMTGTACGSGDADKASDSESASVSEKEQDTGETENVQVLTRNCRTVLQIWNIPAGWNRSFRSCLK